MSKYVVLYNWSHTITVPKPAGHDEYFSWPAGTKTETTSGFSMKKFDDIQEAIEFSNKNDGEILQTVKVSYKVEES